MGCKANNIIEVSVIMPAFNAEEYIGFAIESVQRQTYQEWELLIVNDGSTDATSSILDYYAKRDLRLKRFDFISNMGVIEARNYALSRATGRFIAFLDADDAWAPDKLDRQLQEMKMHNTALSITGYQSYNADMAKIVGATLPPKSLTFIKHHLKRCVGLSTVMLNVEKTGPVKFEQLPTKYNSEDFLFIARLLKKCGPAHGISSKLTNYRVLRVSRSSSKIRAAKSIWYIMRKKENLNILMSLIFFMSYAITSLLKYYFNVNRVGH